MKHSQIVAKTIETAFIKENPGLMAMVASSKEESVEVVFETTQSPAIAAGILLSSQDAIKKMDRQAIPAELARNFDASMRSLPEAVDISLALNGDVLCINVGTGVLFMKLTDTAKQKLKDLPLFSL